MALIFGLAQYLFTRLIDRQAKDVLDSAGSLSDRAVTPEAPHHGGNLIFIAATEK
jgi:hypothetical protein